MCHPLENEIPVVGFSRVKYLEPLVGGEHEVTVRQNVQVTPTDERYLKQKIVESLILTRPVLKQF